VVTLTPVPEEPSYPQLIATGSDATSSWQVAVNIVMVVVELGVAAEQERRAGLAGLVDRVGGGELARGEVGEHLPVQLQVVGNV
jgi:hypothetical protein